MWRTVDHVLRFAYLLVAPAMLVALSAVMPVAGILVGTAIATVIALVGPERWQARVAGVKLVGKLLGGFGRLGTYYQQHPPKPLVYYIAYPVLFPYWLFQRTAREEFLLYRRLNTLTAVIVTVAGVVEYVRSWYPLPLARYIGASIGLFVVQLFVVFAFVMPIVTTIVSFHLRGHRRTLWVALAIAGLAGVLGGVVARRSSYPTSALAMRIQERTAHEPDAALDARRRAVLAAGSRLRSVPSDRDGALALARAILAEHYRADEANAFRLYADPDVAVLYVRFRRKPPLWIASHVPTGNLVERAELLSPGGRVVLGVP